ncbi:diguanylate cyclase [Kineococcus sp. R8]|uniref:GGDEF domain-containing protein n=1 Tax=Kineococcus siccus TaxID=2696567 RepID=UPI0014128525|nr:sensor domain-containing diguanylate cyclase [Kineococcus siccus]NAZ80784.1 diguanylate cyclase [Kineococcus siccus]
MAHRSPPPGRVGALLRDAWVVARQMLTVSALLTVGWYAIVAAGGPEQPLLPQLLAWSLATSMSARPVVALLNRGSTAGRPVLRLVLVGVLSAAGVASSALPSLYPVIIAGTSLITLPRSPGRRTEAAAAVVMVGGSVALLAGVQAGVVPTALPVGAGTTVGGALVIAGLVFLRYAGALSTELAASRTALAAEQHLRVEQLHEASTHDPLTGLLNRAGLEEVVPDALAEGAPGHGTALLYLDLDAFKPVNDTHGHPVGDALLVGVAQRLRTVVRPGDHVARVGGDEFVLLLRAVADEADVAAVAWRARQVVGEPVAVGEVRVVVGVSAGWAVSHDASTAWESLVVRADQAMYDAKRARAAAPPSAAGAVQDVGAEPLGGGQQPALR